MSSTDRVRLLRVLEYDFETLDDMNRHIQLMDVPLQGERRFGRYMTVRSTAFFPGGRDAGLFSITSTPVAPDAPEDAPIILLSRDLSSGLEWGRQHGLDRFVVSEGPRDLDEILATERGSLVAIELPDFRSHPDWGAMRAAIYSRDVRLCSAEDWEETHG